MRGRLQTGAVQWVDWIIDPNDSRLELKSRKINNLINYGLAVILMKLNVVLWKLIVTAI